MEATATQEVQKILVQDIEKLATADHYGNSYVVERCESNGDLKCLYDVLHIPKEYFLTINIVRTNFLSGVFKSNATNEKSQGQIVHEGQRQSYKHLKRLQLLVRDTNLVKLVKPNNNHHYWNDGIVGVVVEDKLKVSVPHTYQKPYYPTTMIRDEKGVYQIETLGMRFDLLETVKIYNVDNHQTNLMTPTDARIYKMLNMWSMIQNTFHTDDVPRETLNEILLQLYFASSTGIAPVPMEITHSEGIVKTLGIVKGFFNTINTTDFVSALAFKTVADSCKSTVNGIKYSTVFNKLFVNVETQEAFDAKVVEISKLYLKDLRTVNYNKNTFLVDVLDTLSEAREMKKAVLKKKSTGAFNKIMDDLEFIQIDKDLYPLSHAAVMNGEIPTSTFFRKSGESYFIYNDNWEIWEEILKDHKEIAITIAAEASKRTTYEKDIMSYFYFTLHALPEYLERHTGKKWKGIPKLVSSSNELDPPTEGSNGVAKSRSALTPIVDNEKSEITVPYVSMQVSGYQTTYCYGLNYSVLERGFSLNGNTVTNDVEKNLNGRDNYGLMFYTLTGTAQGRGYPTFLIIFENMNEDAYGQKYRVHFHRTHPMRSKQGDYNPVHNWTKGCYKWMIGNVNYERILAQQGDLAFVSIDSMPEGTTVEVDSYDNHRFESPVEFLPYEKKEKQNILGYVNLKKDTTLNHHEHLNRVIPKGVYEIRQCRSWEANPKGIWSLRID